MPGTGGSGPQGEFTRMFASGGQAAQSSAPPPPAAGGGEFTQFFNNPLAGGAPPSGGPPSFAMPPPGARPNPGAKAKPDDFEELFGGGVAYDTVMSPERVEVFLLTSDFGETHAGEARAGPVKPDRKSATALSKALLDFDGYHWGVAKLCSPDYGIKARFIRGKAVVQVRFCFDCDILEITFDGKTRTENFDFSHGERLQRGRCIGYLIGYPPQIGGPSRTGKSL